VTGTASLGAPIVGALVTLKDSAGTVRRARTDANGNYALNTSGLTPPFFLRVVTTAPSGTFPAGTTLYSVSADSLSATTINTHVLTDLIVRTWFSAQGVDAGAAFSDPTTNPAPTPLAVQLIAGPVIQALQLWFSRAGLDAVAGAPADATQLNMISSAFVADNTGFDSILHLTTETVDAASGAVTTLTISSPDGATRQTSTLAYDPAASAFRITSTIVTGAASTTSVVAGVAPTADEQAALAAIQARLASLQNTVNAGAFTAGDIMPFLAGDFLNDGLGPAAFAAQFANELSGATITDLHVTVPKSIDLTAGLADVMVTTTLGAGGLSQTGTDELLLENVGGTWLFRGNQRIAEIRLSVGTRTHQAAGVATISGIFVGVGVIAPEVPTGTKTVDGAWVTGGTNPPPPPPAVGNNIFASTPIPQLSRLTEGDVVFDQWGMLSSPLPSSPPLPAGTLFRFDVHAAGAPQGTFASYTVPSSVVTNEAIAVKAPLPGNGVLGNILGQTLTVSWTPLPTTFVVSGVFLHARIADGPEAPSTHSCSVGGAVPSNATSGTITIPATLTCDANQPVQRVNLFVEVEGADGEDVLAMVSY
jgi:hypothetical protein